MARKLKERNPSVITVMCGPGCQFPTGLEIVKRIKHINLVFSGTFLISFSEFVGCCLEGKFEECNHIDGVFSKANHLLVKNPDKSDVQGRLSDTTGVGAYGRELDINTKLELNYTSFLDSVERSFPDSEVEPCLLFQTSRGCKWAEHSQCTFCSLNRAGITHCVMKPARAIEEIRSLFKYSSRCQRFAAVDNHLPATYPQRVLANLNTPSGISLFYFCRVNHTEKDIALMAKAGIREVRPGIEALSTHTLKLMKKGTTAFQNIRFLMNCLLNNIKVSWDLLIGIPDEDETMYKDYVRNIPLLTHLPPPGSAVPIMFFRYSSYFVHAKEYGLELHPASFHKAVYPFSEKTLENLAHRFEDRNSMSRYIILLEEWKSKIDNLINIWRSRWSKDRPRLVLRREKRKKVVYDTRSCGEILHEISDLSERVLYHLVKPRKLQDLAQYLKNVPQSKLEREVNLLYKHDLLFCEDDHFLSLVFLKESRYEPIDEWWW